MHPRIAALYQSNVVAAETIKPCTPLLFNDVKSRAIVWSNELFGVWYWWMLQPYLWPVEKGESHDFWKKQLFANEHSTWNLVHRHIIMNSARAILIFETITTVTRNTTRRKRRQQQMALAHTSYFEIRYRVAQAWSPVATKFLPPSFSV